MSYIPDQPQNLSSIPFRSHTALLLSASLPFLQPAYRHPVELALKFLEFSETLKLFQEFHLSGKNPFQFAEDARKTAQEDGIFGLINTFITDPEGLLKSLSGVCNGSEREIISMFLNMIRVKNFYETYGDLLQMPGLFSGGNPLSSDFDAPPPNSDTFDNSPSDTPFSTNGMPFSPTDLTSMLSDDQKETLDLLKSLFLNE